MSPAPGRRAWWVGGGVLGVTIVAVLAFGVFGVHTLFTDETVDEARPTFRSGAAPTTSPDSGTPDSGTPDSGTSDSGTSTPAPPAAGSPVVETVGRGAFSAGDHPGRGTASVLSDGVQAFVRFEDDFATDNGPDLYAVVYVGGERLELGVLKGNQGAQNYEVPSDVDPASIEAVAVWCKRFDSTFTTATLGPV